MFLAVTTTHALRALARLAAHDGERAVLGRDLARDVGVPPAYLAKVLTALARVGVLAATRGARGGYRLARPASAIRLADVVAPFEGQRVRATCVLRPDQPCCEDAACSAHPAWRAVNDAYRRFLDSTTLADIRCDVDARPLRRRALTRARPRGRRAPTPRTASAR